MAQTYAQAVAENVRAEMARRRVSQKDLADALGLTQPPISRRFHGLVPFDVAELEIVARVLGVTIADLTTVRERQ